MVNYPRHIKQIRRNQYVVVFLMAWFLGAIIFFAWLGIWQQQYRREFNDFATKLETRLAEAKTTFAALREAYNPTASSQALLRLSEDLKALKQPVRPGAFGMPATTHRQAELLSRTLPDLQANLEATASVIDYQQKVSLKLQLLGLRGAGNEAQIRQLAEAWQVTNAELQNMATPPEVAGQHQLLLQRLVAAQGVIAELAELYKVDDRAGFAAKYAELGQIVDGFKEMSTRFKEIMAELDEYRALSFKAIYESL